jgi:hypothetical protein
MHIDVFGSRAATWARNIFEMYCKELHIKQSILLAFGCADAMAASAWRDQPAVLHDAVWCPFRTFTAPATESAEGASAAHLAVPSITSASAISDATSGRLATATEDTLTLYLDVLILEPYLDSDNISIALDSFSFEMA